MSGPYSDPIMQGMMVGRLNGFAQKNRALQRQAAQNMAQAQAIIDEKNNLIAELYDHIDQMAKMREADAEGYAAELAAWRKEHPISHMHDFVGKWSDGDGMRRNSRIRLDATFASAKKKGIRNPEKWIGH